MKPSDVPLHAIPLVGTMGRAEVEFAAAWIVRACQVNGDVWQPVDQAKCEATMKADFDAKREPTRSWATNPFMQPSFIKLVEQGYGRATEGFAIELTEQAFEALAKVR